MEQLKNDARKILANQDSVKDSVDAVTFPPEEECVLQKPRETCSRRKYTIPSRKFPPRKFFSSSRKFSSPLVNSLSGGRYIFLLEACGARSELSSKTFGTPSRKFEFPIIVFFEKLKFWKNSASHLFSGRL